MQSPKHIGLTGGIGSGKSTVSQIFSSLGIPVIDADKIAKDLTKINQKGFNLIVQHFGQQILNKDGDLNRQQLKQFIFSDSKAKQLLESLLHPLIHQEIFQQAALYTNQPYILFDIPLLTEQIKDYTFKRIIVVDIPKSLQLQRLLKRDKMDQSLAEKIIKNQASRQQRLDIATDIIDNSGTLFELKQQVLTIHQKIS